MIFGRASAHGAEEKSTSFFAFAARDEAGWRLLLLLWLTSALFCAGLALVAGAVWWSVPPRVFTEAFYAQFCLPGPFFFTGQPAKNVAYPVTCAAAPLLLPGAYFLARWMVGRVPASKLSFYLRLAVLGSLIFFDWCVSALGFTKVPALEGMPPDWFSYKWFFMGHPFFTVGRFLSVAGALAIGWIFLRRSATVSNRNGALTCVGVIYLLLLPFAFYAPSEIDERWLFDNHFNPLVYALGQSIGGHHFLVDFPHIYGGYVEFLAPFMALMPHRPETIVLAFGIMKVTGVVALFLTARVLIESPFHLVLACCSLLGILSILISDNYFQYSAVRILLPALGLCAAVFYLRSSRAGPYIIASLIAALAPVWNLDTGFVLWMSWTLMLLAREWSEGRGRRVLATLLAQVLLLIAAWAAFWIYLRFVSGHWPGAALLVSAQTVYAGAGFLCVRLLVPDIWLIEVAIYAAALATVAVFYFRRTVSWKIHALLMMTLMGIGLFSYFMGRSCESNLVPVSWLVPLILGLLLSEAGRLVSRGELPRVARAVTLPALFVQTWWALLFAMALPNLMGESFARLEAWQLPWATTPFGQNVAFVQSQTQPRERLLILSNEGGFYYYLSSTLDATGLPSTDEWLFSAQVDRLLASLQARQIPKLIVDHNFFDVEFYNAAIYPRINEAIAQNYRLVTTSPTGELKLYVPKDAGVDGRAP